MLRFRRLALLILPILWALSPAIARAQVLSHPPHPDPAAQRAAFEAQQEILQSPNQFGTNCCQILQIPAAAFTPFDLDAWGHMRSNDAVGYEHMVNGTSGAKVWAPVTLPSGVALDYLDLYAWDVDSIRNICVDLVAFTGWSSPGGSAIATTCSSGTPNYGYFSNFAAGTINNDVLNGGAQYEVVVYGTTPFVSTDLAFKAVDIWWHRQVSPAPGTATFNDVPTNHPFFQFVEALVASGITAGCQASPPLYCPDAPLTRKQMAVFLAKGYGLYWPY